ncbi:glycosyltransferase [Paenibacillus jiagnxiensis]|uniref:glycosyltransferase n=1 Tax=Paenibacillus jiagnxiensis TaxID=3228926 RepID=UPI00346BCA80
MAKPSISLCMITKNEEKYLPKCLSSVKHIVDEIIIVDTGSTDDTLAIAKSFGAKVIQMPWQNSFADARNRSFDEATGDWILWLDADEEMDADGTDKLKELLTRDSVREQRIEGIQFVFCNHLEGGGLEYNYVTRIVRNRPQYRFEGRIHEQILPSMLRLDPHLQLGQVDVHVHHYGYLTQNVIEQDKGRRNIALLQQAISEHPHYPYYYYYWSVELYRDHDLEGALRNMNVFLNMVGMRAGKALLSRAHKYRLIMLADLKRYDDLIRYSEESIARFPGFTDLYHFSAMGYNALGDTSKAVDVLRHAQRIGPAEKEYPSIAGHGTYLTCQELGRLYASAGNSKNADLYFTLASLMIGDSRIKYQEPQVSLL